jgi:hypothetical protein
MSKRYAILGLSVVFALALAVPALGGPSNLIASSSASVKKTANKALKTAKNAQKTANAAQSAAGSAQNAANNANSDAAKALAEAKKGVTAAAAAQATANTAKTTADAAKTAAAAAEANANSRLKGSSQVVGESSASSTAASKFASASCTGRPVLGGGFSVGGENNKVTVSQSEEQLYGGGWFVAAQTIAGQGTPTWAITAVVICGNTN